MKNKKGFFLAEAIIITTLVALTITLIFPQFANKYERMKQRLINYNRAPDVYTANYIYANIGTLVSSIICDDGIGITCDPGAPYYKYTFNTQGNIYNITQIIQSTDIDAIKTNYEAADINLKNFLSSIESPTSGVILIFEFENENNVRRYVALYKGSGIESNF